MKRSGYGVWLWRLTVLLVGVIVVLAYPTIDTYLGWRKSEGVIQAIRAEQGQAVSTQTSRTHVRLRWQRWPTFLDDRYQERLVFVRRPITPSAFDSVVATLPESWVASVEYGVPSHFWSGGMPESFRSGAESVMIASLADEPDQNLDWIFQINRATVLGVLLIVPNSVDPDWDRVSYVGIGNPQLLVETQDAKVYLLDWGWSRSSWKTLDVEVRDSLSALDGLFVTPLDVAN